MSAPGRPFADLRGSGLLWLINASVFHPRGVALALHLDDDSGEATGWSLIYAGDGEPFVFADDPEIAALFQAAEATLSEAKR